jgi:DNA polymerase-3 subunit alpha
VKITEITAEHVDYHVTIGGIVTTIRKIVTKKGDPMAFVTIEDTFEKIEVIVFPKLYEKNPNLWEEGKIVFIKGTVNNKDGSLKILADSADTISKNDLQKELPKEPVEERMTPPDPSKKRYPPQTKPAKENTSTKPNPFQKPRALFIRVTQETEKTSLQQLSQALTQAPQGYTPVYLVVILSQSNTRQKIRTPFKIEITQDLLESVGRIIGKENVRTMS